ncbi:hypothetical protein JYT74_01455 [Crocinitomix catalasitica]|nr:hypothetical protein [Crocinitomix catalasitica]
MKKFLFLFLISTLFCLSGQSQNNIKADAFYRGVWVFTGDKSDAPTFFSDEPYPVLCLKTGTQQSFVSLSKIHAGYPAPNYFIAEIVGDTIVAQILEGSSLDEQVGTVLKFRFQLQVAEQILTIGYLGKNYVYGREP